MTDLKLIILESDDVPVVSAQLQDAALTVGDIGWSAREQRLVFVCNRFDWLARESDPASLLRRQCALRVERVGRVQSRGFSPRDRRQVLSLLAITFAPDSDPARAPSGTLCFVFAGDAEMQVDVECVEMVLEDLGPAWQASRVPAHPEQPG